MTISLKDVGSGYKRSAINSNFQAIEDEINDNLLSKNGGVGLEADLDANSQRIINLADGVQGSDGVTLDQLNGIVTANTVGYIAAQTEVKLGAEAVANVFTFSGIAYVPGGNNLSVYRNGQKLGKTEDYSETTTTSITLTFTPNATDRFEFVTNTGVTNSTTTTGAITHIQEGVLYNLSEYLQRDGLISMDTETQLGSAAVARVFTLSSISYQPATNNLTIYRNGVRLESTEDYTETSPTSVTLTFNPNSTDRFIFVTNERQVNGTLSLPDLPVYADEAAAIAGGLSSGEVYRTSTGELRIKL